MFRPFCPRDDVHVILFRRDYEGRKTKKTKIDTDAAVAYLTLSSM